MGRQGPLTAFALGRSPYDDVVQGEGEEDARDTKQLYDEKGRPINPETKRLNREIVRSHNEVMHVIGVAEPDPSSNEAEVLAARRYMQYEQLIGARMERLGAILMEVGVWGFWGLRRRMMIYKSYSSRPFWKLATICREETPRPLSDLLLAGLPTQVVWKAVDWLRNGLLGSYRLPKHLWLLGEWAGAYIHTHLTAYIFLQRSGLIPELRLPSPAFFIPFTSTSPIFAPAPPADLQISSIVKWVGAAAINASPILLVALWRKYYSRMVANLGLHVFLRLPNIDRIIEPAVNPVSFPDPAGLFRAPGPSTSGAPATADAPALQEASTPEEGAQQPDQDPATNPVSRRPSTFSGRGDDYGSDDEDNGAISGTLISFDVEATETTDAAPPQAAQGGVWSAELRPTTGTEARSTVGQQAVYLRNSLTKQPLVHAARILSRLPTCLLLCPFEAIAYRSLARSYVSHRGLSAGGMWESNFFGAVTWGWVANYLAVELLHLAIQCDIWAGVTFLGRSYHLTPEEWSDMTPEEHAKLVKEVD